MTHPPDLAVGASVWWPVETFLSGEAAFPGAIDITGPARTLTFGPYARLAPGLWRAEAMFEVCADAAGYDYALDFGAVDRFEQCIVRPLGAGRHAAALQSELRSEAPVELRIRLGRAAFHGCFRLVGARVTMLECGRARA